MLQIKFQPTDAARRTAFTNTGSTFPYYVTVDIDPEALPASDRALIAKYCPDALSGKESKLDCTINATDAAGLLSELRRMAAADAEKRAGQVRDIRAVLSAYIAGETDTIGSPYLDGRSIPGYNVVELPEFSDLKEAYLRRSNLVQAEKEAKEREAHAARAAKIAQAARKEEEDKAAREAWIAEHGTEYLKRLAADGYEYTNVAREEWAAINAPGFSDCENWRGVKRWERCTTPRSADLSALDSAREAFPDHSAQVVTVEYHDESEETAIQVRFNTPFGAPALEKLVSDFDGTEPVRRELTAEAAQRRR